MPASAGSPALGGAAGTACRRATVRLLVLLLVPLALLTGGASPALAHPALVSSTPGAGYAVTDAPKALVLTFNEPVTLRSQPLAVTGPGGRPVALAATLEPDRATLRAVPATPLPAGAYEVTYRVIGTDGDAIAGSFRFGVATPVTASTSSAATGLTEDRPSPWPTVLRGLLFLGLSLALGGAYAARRAARATGGLPGVPPLVAVGSLVGLVGAAGLLLALGPLSALPAQATQPGAGRLIALEVLMLLLAVATARPARALAVTALLGVVGLEAFRAHPREAAGALGAVALGVHLLAGALWLGGLVHTLRLARHWRSRRLAARVAAATYARTALLLFLLVSATGTADALLLLPDAADWTGTAYGRVLLVKLALFAAVAGTAVLARRRLSSTGDVHAELAQQSEDARPAPLDPAHAGVEGPGREALAAGGAVAVAVPERPGPRGPRSSGRMPLARAATWEAGLLAAVVVAAAAVTSLTPPRLVPAASLVAAPVGPAVRQAQRVNQISVALVASRGRIEVHAYAPDAGSPTTFRLRARLAGPDRPSRTLSLASCGPACWTGDAAWVDGVNMATFDVRATGWRAGQAALDVVWPPVPAPRLLRQVQKAMGARSAIDTQETVTSGFDVDIPTRSRRTGQEFLASQPWSEGGATDPVVVTTGMSRTLLFALPALDYHFAMRLDAQGRIVSERIVTPNHLLVRSYSFPAALHTPGE